jgi:hypothetical protein
VAEDTKQPEGKMKRTISVMAAASLLGIFFLSHCGLTRGNYLLLDNKGDIALLSFSLDRTINADGDSSIDQGAGILNSQEDKATYWDEHQKAVDAMYQQFKVRISAALLGTPLHDIKNLETDQRYLDLTAPKTIKFMGISAINGWNMLSAAGTRYVSSYDNAVLDSLCDVLGVQLILTVESKAFYRVLDSMHLIMAGPVVAERIPLGRIVLSAELFLHEKGRGMVWSRTYSNLIPASPVDLHENREMKTEDYSAQLTGALEGIYSEITADANRGRAYAAQQK